MFTAVRVSCPARVVQKPVARCGGCSRDSLFAHWSACERCGAPHALLTCTPCAQRTAAAALSYTAPGRACSLRARTGALTRRRDGQLGRQRSNKAASRWIRAAARAALVRTRACALPQRWAPACLAGCAAVELQPVPPGPRPLLALSFRLGLGPEAEVPSSEELLLATPGLPCPSGRGSGTPGLAQALLLPCRTVYCRRSGQAWQGRAQAKLSNPHYVSPSQPVAQECRLWA